MAEETDQQIARRVVAWLDGEPRKSPTIPIESDGERLLELFTKFLRSRRNR